MIKLPMRMNSELHRITKSIQYECDRLRCRISKWDTLAEFTQKCDASTWMLQNTSKSDRDTSTELGKQQKSGLKISKGDFFMDHERSCLRSLFTRSDTVEKQNLPVNAFRFPEFIETSPLKREGGTEKTHCPKVQDVLRPPCQVFNSYDCTITK